MIGKSQSAFERMKIYTKTGDKGETSLVSGERVTKDHLRIEAYGTVDELNATLGLMRDSAPDDKMNPLIETIQSLLFTIGSNLAATDKNKMALPTIEEQHILDLEAAMDGMDENLEPLKNFILPGGDPSASLAHLGRTVCRRAERRVVSLMEHEAIDGVILRYLNRLSDFLFTLARYYTKAHQGVETPWRPAK